MNILSLKNPHKMILNVLFIVVFIGLLVKTIVYLKSTRKTH